MNDVRCCGSKTKCARTLLITNLRCEGFQRSRGLLLAALSCKLFPSGSLLVSKQIVEERAGTRESIADLPQLATLLEYDDSGKRAQTTLKSDDGKRTKDSDPIAMAHQRRSRVHVPRVRFIPRPGLLLSSRPLFSAGSVL